MREVWLVLRILAAQWKNRRNMAGIIVLIIIMISTFCYVKKLEPEEIKESGKIALGVSREDTSEYATLLMGYFNENEDFLAYVDITEDEVQALHRALKAGELDAYLVIPENFADSMIRMENLPITAKISMKNPTKALVLRHVMEAYETYIEAVEVNCTALYRRMKEENFPEWDMTMANVEISMDLIYTALGKDCFFKKQQVETETTAAETLSLAEHYQYTLVYFVLLFSYIPAGLWVISLQKKGMSGRLKAVNISKGSVLAAAAIPHILLSLVVLAGVLRMKGVPERTGTCLLYVLPCLFAFLLFAVFCRGEGSYLFFCCMILVCLAVLGGGLVPEEFLPDSFRKIAEWMPNRNFTHVMGGVRP